jgi:hypothetical protein
MGVNNRSGLWRAIRLPVFLLGVSAAAIATAAVLDRTPAREWALTIGAPALTILLPIGVGWLLLALIVYSVRRNRRRSAR